MRTWLFNRIMNLTTLPAEVRTADRIISSGSADMPKPVFLLVSMLVEQPFLGMPPETGAGNVPFTIWVHDKPGSMVAIDDIAIALKNGIPTQDGFVVGNKSVHEVRWQEIGQDGFDDHFNTNTRPVRFNMVTSR